MLKIAIIGAGSTVFLRSIVTDILLIDSLRNCHIYLHDIDARRLAEAEQVVSSINQRLGASVRLSSSLERKPALQSADFVICMFQVGGYEPATVIDFDIPKKYGLRQTIGDSLGIGGIMRGLRTVPVLLDIGREMLELCPQAWMLQYVNPMAINCWALQRLLPDLRLLGLCHSVRNTINELAEDLGEKPANIAYTCAGINHVAFYTMLEKIQPDQSREDLYPRLHKLAQSKCYGRGMMDCANHVRYDLLSKFGYFVTESSEHLAEYVPWYIKSSQPELIREFDIPLDEYPRRCLQQISEWRQQSTTPSADEAPLVPSGEYAAEIIQGLANDEPQLIYANIKNNGLIANLPNDCCVELACMVDSAGVHPQPYGALPAQLAALMQSNINVQALVVEALAQERKEHIYHAAYMDSHTAAELNLDQITALVDELLAAHSAWLPSFATS